MNWSPRARSDAGGASLAHHIPAWLAGGFLEGYVHWREECEGVQAAYELWQGRERSDRGLAFAAYQAALEREEHAALALCDTCRGGAPFVAVSGGP